MKSILYLSSLLFFLGLNSCFTYEAQFDGPLDISTDLTDPTFPKSLVYVSGGRVLLSNHLGRDSIIINSGANADIASINSAHTKVLFREVGSDIQEYDIATNAIIRSIPNSANAQFFDYHPDGESIFHFTLGGLLTIEGKQRYTQNPLNLIPFFPGGGNNKRVYGATLLPNDEIIMSVYYEAFGVEHALVRTDGISILDDRGKNFDYLHFRLSESGNKLLASDDGGPELSSAIISIFTLSDDTFINGKIGTPDSYFSQTWGYAVDDDDENSIFIPNQDDALIPPFGNVTSIDY